MDDSVILFGLLAAYLLAGPAIAVWALLRARRLTREVAALRAALEGLGAPLAEAQRAEAPSAEPPPAAEAEAVAGGSVPAAGGVPPEGLPEAEPAPAGGRDLAGLERSLTSRWLVWLGGVTLALGGAFLVKYSIDQGWLGPLVRVLLGLGFGALLVAAGEALRRRPLQQAVAAIGPNFIPPSLTAAGLFSAYVSLYAAFALYGLMAPPTAFITLALLAWGAIALSLLQGPFIALLGLVGGFATPFLVAGEQPSAWALFGYLLALILPAMAIVRLVGEPRGTRAWSWLPWAALAGAVAWPWLWLTGPWSAGDALPLGGYLVLAAAIFLLLRRVSEAPVPALGQPGWPRRLSQAEACAWLAALLFAVLGFLLVRVAESAAPAIGAALTLAALYLWIAWRDAALDGLTALAALLALALVAAWELPTDFAGIAALYSIEGRDHGAVPGPWVPEGFEALAVMAALLAALLGLGGQAGLRGAARPALWAAVSALTPVAILAVVYWRIAHLGLDLKWSALALALAALNLLAAAWHARRTLSAERDAVLGFTALGVTAAVSLGAAMALHQAWLTVVLSLQLPVLGWLSRRFAIASLRPVAAALAAVVLIRLVFNPYILDYPFGSTPGLSWVLYGYGIPAAAFWLAARQFGRAGGERLPALLDGGCLVFVFLLVSFEIRSLLGGTARVADDRLLEASLQSIAWLILALVVHRLDRRRPRPVLAWGWRILAGLAALQVVVVQLGLENPLLTAEPVEGWPLLNELALAYTLPAGFALVFARLLGPAGHPRLAVGAGVLGLALLMVAITLELRRAFHGPVLAGPWPGEAELYAYSAAWLLYAGALLALGIARQVPALRYASLAVLLATVAKVFLLDLADLAGLWRVASFVGLGLTLVGIGYLYQRFVFPPRVTPEAPPEPAAAGRD